MTAAALPALLGAAALAIDMSYYAYLKTRMQRIADTTALAGAVNYAATNNLQMALNYASNLAQINQAPSGSLGNTSVSMTFGVVNGSDRALKATVSYYAPLMFMKLFSSNSWMTITASAWAEVGPARGPQPCVLALSGDGTGVTTTNDVTLTGGANIVLTGCSLRSDASISVGGNASISTPSGIYSAGGVSVSGSGTTSTSPIFQGSGQIPDPYAQNTSIQTALSSLGSGGQSQPPGSTLNPGTYSSLSFSGPVTLQPGLYIVNGSISFGSQANVTGTGVTIVSNGSVSMNSSASVNLTAPTPTTAQGGAVADFLYANASSGQTIQWNGASIETMTGIFYAPNSTLTINGNAGDGSNGCLVFVAAIVNIKGSANLAANCTTLGSDGFGSLPGAAVLVR